MTSSWFDAVDNYCERSGPGFLAEPVNAISNAAFLVAALHVFSLWRRQQHSDRPMLWLIAVTTFVGIGSFLFHTFASRWAMLADVLPIGVFIYSYFLLAMRRYLRLGRAAAATMTLLFAAFSLSFERMWFFLLPGVTLNGSVGYLPALMALAGVGATCLIRTERGSGRALLWAALIFALSLVLRSVDSRVCSALPVGTHALRHVLNALVLWILMIGALTHRSEERPLHVPR